MIQLVLSSYVYKKVLGTLVPYCKKCKSGRLVKDGWYKSFQQYRCKRCGFRFSFSSDLPRRRFCSEVIDFAVNMYITVGISLRKLAKKILKFFKTKISHMTIHRWIKTFQKTTPVVNTGLVWHADETAIRIKGKVHWLWLVMDRKTRTIITHHLSRTRKYKDAKHVIMKARAKKGKPELLITDGLWEYIRASKKTFGWRHNPHQRFVNGAFGPNSIIERLNKELKRRYKWFGTFQNFKSAENFIQQWIKHYNTDKVT